MWLKSCTLEGSCFYNDCSDGCHNLARFGDVFGFAREEVERDGTSNGNGDDSQKTGYQCDVYNNCFCFDGFADAVGSESIDGVRGLRGFDGADGYDGHDGVGGGSDGVDGSGFDGSGGLDGLGDSSKKERTES